MPKTQSTNVNIRAMNRYVTLRGFGIPATISSNSAYYLSGGIKGERRNFSDVVLLATIARDVPDCLNFVSDYFAETA